MKAGVAHLQCQLSASEAVGDALPLRFEKYRVRRRPRGSCCCAFLWVASESAASRAVRATNSIFVTASSEQICLTNISFRSSRSRDNTERLVPSTFISLAEYCNVGKKNEQLRRRVSFRCDFFRPLCRGFSTIRGRIFFYPRSCTERAPLMSHILLLKAFSRRRRDWIVISNLLIGRCHRTSRW